MGHKKHKYLQKQREQRIAKQENERYYQNSSNQHTPRRDSERTADRKLDE